MDKSEFGIETDSGSPSAISTKSVSRTGTGSSSKEKIQKDKRQREKERFEREKLVLWRQPWRTSKYCVLELMELMRTRSHVPEAVMVFSILFGGIYKLVGPDQLVSEEVRRNTWFFVFWLGLGVLSSAGFGTGIPTFLLYLGPHIARVTLAAYECNSLKFPSPPYPDDIICPAEPYEKRVPNLWDIMSKVRLEALLWGVGAALGELPLYFMAKAKRFSGYDPDDAEDLVEFEDLNAEKDQKNLSLLDKCKLFVKRVAESIGFFGILACATFLNPLFDLAVIASGYFLVPFWTFFWATLIGKAILKLHFQKIFVIVAFNETLIETTVDLLAQLPYIGIKLQDPVKSFLKYYKERLHRLLSGAGGFDNMTAKILKTYGIGFVGYLIVSIINILAQSYHKRIHKKIAN